MQSKLEKEKEYHNKRFSKEIRQSAHKFYSIELESRSKFVSLINENVEGKNILELGSGKGSYAFALAKSNANVFGIDISDVAIKYSIEKAKELNLEKNTFFEVMNAEDLYFKNDQFDRLFGSSILHHLDMKKAIPELSRVLNEKGEAIFIEPLGHNIFINLYRMLTPNFRTKDEHPFVISDFKILHDNFNNIEIDYFHLTTLLATPFRNLKFFGQILTLFQKIDKYLFRLFPFLRRQAWQIIIKASKPIRNK